MPTSSEVFSAFQSSLRKNAEKEASSAKGQAPAKVRKWRVCEEGRGVGKFFSSESGFRGQMGGLSREKQRPENGRKLRG